jgi:hypothetical protein
MIDSQSRANPDPADTNSRLTSISLVRNRCTLKVRDPMSVRDQQAYFPGRSVRICTAHDSDPGPQNRPRKRLCKSGNNGPTDRAVVFWNASRLTSATGDTRRLAYTRALFFLLGAESALWGSFWSMPVHVLTREAAITAWPPVPLG